MTTKSANETARVQLDIKRQAVAILDKIRFPVSVLINTLYRQIIMTGDVPYSLTILNSPKKDSMINVQFHAMMKKSLSLSTD